MGTFLRAVLLLAVTVSVACEASPGEVISPQPIPATLVPQFAVAQIALERVEDSTQIRGGAGAVSAHPGTIWAFNVDQPSRAEAPIGADGSFLLRTLGSPSAHYHLVALVEGQLGWTGVHGTEAGGPAQERSPEPCLRDTLVTPMVRVQHVVAGSSKTVDAVFSNACDRDLVVSAAGTFGDPFALEGDAAGVLAPRAQRIHKVRFTPQSAGVHVGAIVFELAETRVVMTVLGEATN